MRLKIILLILFALSCCYPYKNQAKIGNKNFKKKYGNDAKIINADRKPKKKSDTIATAFETPYQQHYFPQDDDERTLDYYIGSVYFGQPFPYRSQPYYEDYNTDNFSNNPDKMFEIAYNNQPSKPFHRIGLEFDTINIPNQDKFGIAAYDNNKHYAINNNDYLQKNIEYLVMQNKNKAIAQQLIEEKADSIYYNQIKEYLKKDEILEENPFYVTKNKRLAPQYKNRNYIHLINSQQNNDPPKADQQNIKTNK
jgi:hypothetical protein